MDTLGGARKVPPSRYKGGKNEFTEDEHYVKETHGGTA